MVTHSGTIIATCIETAIRITPVVFIHSMTGGVFMKKYSRMMVLTLFAGIVAALFIVAGTDVMAPVMRFVLSTNEGTPLQLIGCIAAAAIGLRFVYMMLHMVGGYYSNELDKIQKEKMFPQGGE